MPSSFHRKTKDIKEQGPGRQSHHIHISNKIKTQELLIYTNKTI